MSAAPSTPQQTDERLVFAPDGMAWIDGYDRYTGYWDIIVEAEAEPDQAIVRYPEDDEDGSQIVRVAADETAPKADVMYLAARVEELRGAFYDLKRRVRAAGAVLEGGE